VIELSRPQLSFAEGLIREEVEPLWEPWMRHVDTVLADGELMRIVYQAAACPSTVRTHPPRKSSHE
jgi:hypothetical protein